MKHKIQYILFLMCVAAPAMAATPDSVYTEHHSVWNSLSRDAWKNPALHGAAYNTDYSQLAIDVDYKNQTDAFVLQKGTGHTKYQVEADTYLRLSDRTAVWGKASYLTGHNRNIKWSSVSDYEIIEPYILADTLGGRTESERYVFEGGYATRLNKLLLGGEMMFRAEHEYRTTDPRMRAIVSDLTLRAGAAYQTSRYNWGAAFEANIYKQTDNVTFFRETGVIPEFQLTGLGAIYVRFSGEVNNLYFNGGGTQLYLNASPVNGNGLFGNITLGQHRYERIVASLNSLPLTKLYRHEARLQTGWKHRSQHDAAIYVDANYTRRLGDENMVGSSQSNNYPILTTLTMYKNDILDASINALYGSSQQACWHVMLKAGYQQNNEKYVEPERKMSYSRIYGMLGGQLITGLSHRSTLTCGLNASYIKNVDSELSIPVLNTETAAVEMLNHNFRYLKADYTKVDASVRADHTLADSRYGIFAELRGSAVFCSASDQEQHISLKIGMTF